MHTILEAKSVFSCVGPTLLFYSNLRSFILINERCISRFLSNNRSISGSKESYLRIMHFLKQHLDILYVAVPLEDVKENHEMAI